MSQPRQSRALVIVNTDFCGSDGDIVLGTRRGARREAEQLSKTLSRLNYQVELMHNKTAKEIEELYQQGRCPPASPEPPPRLPPAPGRLPRPTPGTPGVDAGQQQRGRVTAECSREHGDYFVSIISSHGEQGVIFGCDSEPVKLTRVFQILSSKECPVLTKIPKIFFIQVTG